jgi:hypothetical protein
VALHGRKTLVTDSNGAGYGRERWNSNALWD